MRHIHATPPRTIHVNWPKAVAKITDDLDVLLTFYDFPAEPVRAGATFINGKLVERPGNQDEQGGDQLAAQKTLIHRS